MREELIEKMRQAYITGSKEPGYSATGMAAALDVAVGELLGDITEAESMNGKADCFHPTSQWARAVNSRLENRRSRYLPKPVDPAVEAVLPFVSHWGDPRKSAEAIVAAVRNADKGAN